MVEGHARRATSLKPWALAQGVGSFIKHILVALTGEMHYIYDCNINARVLNCLLK
jgi:hypothetical protein